MKVRTYFTLPELSATKTVMWKCHVDEYAKGRYYMILCRDLLTSLVLNLQFSEQITEADDGTLKELSAPMVDLGAHELKKLNTGEITPK